MGGERENSQRRSVSKKRPMGELSFTLDVAKEKYTHCAQHTADGGRGREHSIARGSDVKNVLGENRQQRAIIADSDDDKVEQDQGENDRFGKKKSKTAEDADERKALSSSCIDCRWNEPKNGDKRRNIKQRV